MPTHPGYFSQIDLNDHNKRKRQTETPNTSEGGQDGKRQQQEERGQERMGGRYKDPADDTDEDLANVDLDYDGSREYKAAIRPRLQSGNWILFLQEVPKVKVSHCRAWICMPAKQTAEPVIQSYYHFTLKNVSSLYSSMNTRFPYMYALVIFD